MTNCSNIEQRIKPFLDDLLSEEEYQSIHAHLDQCTKCRQYVSAIGSLSYTLKELGHIEVPRDLADTVLFNLKKQPEEEPPKTAGSKKPLIIGVLAVLFIGASVYFGFHYFKTRQQAEEKAKTPPVAAQPVQEENEESDFWSDSEEKAQKETGKTDKSDVLSEVYVTPEGAEEEHGQPEENLGPAKEMSYHFHFPHIRGTDSDKIAGILARLDVQPDYRRPGILIATVPSSVLGQFVDEVESIAPRVLPLRNPDFQKLSLPNQLIHLSVYFEEADESKSNSLHWHVQVKTGNEFRIFDLLRQMDLSLAYDSSEVIVFTVSSAKLEELSNRMKALQGVSGDFTPPPTSQSLSSYPIQVSIYFAED